MEVDFHSMKRKQLQALCKKHVIPANLTNLEMANRLSSLLKETENSNAYEPSSSSNLVVEVSNKTDSAVVTKKAKKVRFRRENETFIFVQSDAEVTTIRQRTRRTFKKDPQESSLHVTSIASEVESSASKKQVERRRISKRLKSSGSEVISLSSEAESSAQKKPVGKRRVSKKSNSSNLVGLENVDVIEKLPEVLTTPWKLRSRGFAGEKGNEFDDGDVEASTKNVPLKQQGRITRQSKCQLNDISTTPHRDGKTESGSIKVVPKIVEGKKSIKRTSNLVCKEEIKVQVEPQDIGAVPRRSRRLSVVLQAKDPQEPVMKANEIQNHLPVRKSSRCVSKRQSFVQQNSIQEAKTKKQRRSSMQPLAKRTSETESFEVSNEKSEHVVDFTATNHSEAQVPRTSRRSIRANYPQESVMKENELQSQVLLRQSSRCASKRQSLAPSNSVSVSQAKKLKSSSLQSLAKEHVVDLTAVVESAGVENPVEVEKEIVQLVDNKVNNGSCVVSHKTASLTSYLDCQDVLLKLNAVRDSETELSSEKKLCYIHEELLCVDQMDKSNDNKYTVAVQMNRSGSPVNVTNGTENEEFNELQNQRTAQPSVESVPIAPAYLRDQETAFVAEVQCSGQSYSRIADTDENAEQDETSGNEMSPKHSEVSVIVSESLQDGVISGEEKHDLEGHVDYYAPRDHSLGLREDTRESPANMTVLDANESKTMKCTDATELQESKVEELFKASSEKSKNPTEVDADGGGGGTDLEGPSFQSYSVNEAVSMMNDSVTNEEQHDCIDQKQVTELCPSLGLPSHDKLEEIASSIDNSYESRGTMYEVMASLGKESDCLPTLGSEPLGIEREETTIFQKCHSQDSLDRSRQEEIVGTIFNKMAPNEDEAFAGEATDEKTTVDAKLVNEESNGILCAADNVMDEGPQKETHMQLILPELRTREDDEAFHIIPDSVELNTERFNIIADTIGDDGIDESRSTSLEVMTSLVKGSECLLQIHEMIEESKPLNVERGEILQECCGQDSAYLVSDAAEICTGKATNDAKLDGGENIDEMEVKYSVHDTPVSSIVSGNDAVYLEIQNILGQDSSDISPSSHEENNDEHHEISTDSCAADNVTDEGPHKLSHMQPTLPELQTREVDGVFHLIPDIRELNVDKSGIIADTVGGDDMNESRATSLKVTTSLEKGSERLLQIHEMTQENEPLNVEREEISTVQEFCGQDSAYLVPSAAQISAGEATNGAQLDGDEDTDEMEVKDPVQDTADLVTGSGNDAVSLVKENYFGQHSSDQSPSSHEENNDEYHEIAPDSCAADNVTDEGPHKESHMQSTLPELQNREVDEVFHLIPDIRELDVDKSTIGGDDMDESRATSLEVTSLEKRSECLLQIHEMIQESEHLNVEREEISTVQEFCGHDFAYLVSSAAEICAGEATNVAKLYGDEDTCTDEMEVKDLVQDIADSVTGCGNDAVSLENENYTGQHSSDQSPSSQGNDFLEGEYEVFNGWEMRLFSLGVPKELEKEPTGSQQKGDSKLIDLIEMTDGEVFTELEIRLLSAESTGSQQKDDTEMIDLIDMKDTEVFTELQIRLLSAESTGSKRVNENADHSELREDLIVPKDLVVENEDLKAEEVRNLEDSGSAVCKDLVVENVDPMAEEVSNLEDSGSALCNEAFLYDKKPHEEEHESFLENSTEIRNLSNANCGDNSTVVKECTDCYNEGIACNDSRMVECATALCDSAINIDDRAAQENLRLSNNSGELNTERSNIIADTIGGDDMNESAPTSLEVMTSSVKESDCLLQIHEMFPESEPFGVERGVQECCHEDSANLVPNAVETGSGEAANGAKQDADEDEMGVKDQVQDTAGGNDAVSLVLQNDFSQDSSDRFPSSHVNDFLEGESEVFTEWEMRLFSSEAPKELEKEPTGSQQKEEAGRSRHNTELVGDLLEMTDTDVFTDLEIKLLSEESTGYERADDNADPSEARGDLFVSKDLVDENEDLKADEVSNFEGSGNAICNEAFLYDKKPNQEEEHESFPDNSTILSKGNCEDDSRIVKERSDCDNEDITCKGSRIVECTTAPSDSTMNIDEIVAQEKLSLPNHIISSSMGGTEGKLDAVAVTPKKPMNILDMKENVVSSKGQHLTATKSVAKRQPLMDLQQKLI